MSIAVDSRQQQQFGAGAFAPADHPQMRFYSAAPQFTNPWQQPSQQQQQQHQHQHQQTTYGAPTNDDATSAAPQIQSQGHARKYSQHMAPNVSMASYQQQQQMPAMSLPSGTYSSAGSFSHHLPQVDSPLQGFMSQPGRYSTDFGSNMFGQLPMKPQEDGIYTGQPQIRSNSFVSLANRRESHPSVPSVTLTSPTSTVSSDNSSLMNFGTVPAMPPHQNSGSLDFLCSLHNASEAERNSFSDALDASRGMVAMSQDITPRNIYDVYRASRGSVDSYGFPATHSHNSSFSSSSSYPMYYGGSVSEASCGDYGSATESGSARSSCSQNSFMGGYPVPGGPAAMMGHFSSKINSSSQKKHKCKICDKRFTRPSSLQTHMYSHTGEKPFACDVEGCGRQFSVVSNLRRHRKVHRGEHEAELGSCSEADD